MCVRFEVLVRRPKSEKVRKVNNMQPLFTVCEGVMVIKRRGSGGFWRAEKV